MILSALILFYPFYVKDIAVNDIDTNLLSSTSFMLMLSKGGISIERVIERSSETESSEHLRNLYNKFLANITVYGYNPQDALVDISTRSPSLLFKDFIRGLISTIQTNGDLNGQLHFESNKLLLREEEQAEKLINSLGTLSEIYVTALVIAPIIVIMLLTTFSFSGGQSNSYGILNTVVFLGIPLIAILLLIVFDMKVS